MPKITETQRESRRQQILDAALVCFSRDGFHNTTTADIVRESGVSQGSLYLYFAGKDDIVVALADDRHQREAFLTAVAQSEQDPVLGLLALIELHGRGLGDPGRLEGRRVGVQGWAEALRNPRIHDSVVEGLTAIIATIERLIERGRANGQVRPEVNPEAVARTLVAMFHGMVLQAAWGEPLNLAACGPIIRGMIAGLLTTKGLQSLPAVAPEPETEEETLP